MYGLTLLTAAFFAGQASATALGGAYPLGALLRRQTLDPSEIPAQCQSDCSDAVSALNTCADVNCLCSSTTNQGLYTCLECALNLDPEQSLLSQSQDSLASYEDTCAQAGVTVASLTLTLPAGSTSASASATHPATSTTAGKTTVTFNGSSTAAASQTSPANTVETASSASSTAAGSQGNPLNGAGMIGVSTASLLVAVGFAMTALF